MKPNFREWGVIFGYPKCCTDWVLSKDANIETPITSYMDKNQINIHGGRGFIPCPSCAKKVLDEGLLLNDLIVSRKHNSPYPIYEKQDFERYGCCREDYNIVDNNWVNKNDGSILT